MLELICRVYNINERHSSALLNKCKWLSDYIVFVDKVREYHKNHNDEELHQDIEIESNEHKHTFDHLYCLWAYLFVMIC